jgi:prophage regulatory protein
MPHQIMNDSPNDLTILRLPAVKRKTGLSSSTIYAYMGAGTFPPNIRLTARCVGWFERDVNSWLLTRAQAA